MAVQQISQIQIRRGFLQDLGQLASGEFGWALDQLKLFIGNGSLSEGVPEEGNTEIMTRTGVLNLISGSVGGGSAGAEFNYRFKGLEGGYQVQTSSNAAAPIIRTLQSKLDDHVNILDFGAVGDGVEDDLDAIQRAIDQIYDRQENYIENKTRRIINFHPGIYAINGELRIPPYCVLRGAGKDSVIIRQISSAATCLFKTTTSTGVYDSYIPTNGTRPGPVEISNITFEFYAIGNRCIGLLESAKDVSFHRCRFKSDTLRPMVDAFSTAVKIRSNYLPTKNITFTECDFQGLSTGADIHDNLRLEEVVLDRCTFTDLYRGILASTNRAQSLMGLRVTNSVFDSIYGYGILTVNNVCGVTSTTNTYLDVGTGYTSNIAAPLNRPMPSYIINSYTIDAASMTTSVDMGQSILFVVTSVNNTENLDYEIINFNSLTDTPPIGSSVTPMVNRHTVITPVIKFSGHGSFSFGDYFYRSDDDDYLVDTVEHAATDVISFDTFSANKYGDTYQTIGRSVLVQQNSTNYIPLLSKYLAGRIDYRIERLPNYRAGSLTFSVDPISRIICYRDSYTEVVPVNIDLHMEYNNYLSQSNINKPILLVRVDDSASNAVITYDVKGFVDEILTTPALITPLLPANPIYRLTIVPTMVSEGSAFNVEISGRNVPACVPGPRMFKITVSGTNITGQDFDIPLINAYSLRGFYQFTNDPVDEIYLGQSIDFRYTTVDLNEELIYIIETSDGIAPVEPVGNIEIIVSTNSLPYVVPIRTRLDFISEGIETAVFKLSTWCSGDTVSNAVVAFDIVSINDLSVNPLPPITPAPTLSPFPTATPIPTSTPITGYAYTISSNVTLMIPGDSALFTVTSVGANENLLYEIADYSLLVQERPILLEPLFPNCISGQTVMKSVTARTTGGVIFGDNNYGYTDDSDLGMAAVHSGLLQPGQTQNIYFTCIALRNNFPGSIRNSVTSYGYEGGWCAMTLSLTAP